MAWTDVQCNACGKTYQVQMYGKNKEREWKVDNWRGTCEECKLKIHAEETAKAIKSADAQGLPDLEGTPKQVAWAEKIRIELIKKVEDLIQFNQGHGVKLPVDDVMDTLKSIQKASFWIDHRSCTATALNTAYQIYKDKPTVADVAEKQAEKEASEEATLKPSGELATDGVAEINQKGNQISVRLPEKNDDFKNLVKSKLGYRWNDGWNRKINNLSGPVEDRVVELGVELLAAGFKIRIYDNDLRARIIAGDYQQEQLQWVCAPKSISDKKLALYWDRRCDENLYQKTRRIAGIQWDSPYVTVPVEYFAEVLDFAEIEGFEITDRARARIDAAEKADKAALVIDVKPKQRKTKKKASQKLDIKSAGIDDDLKD